MTSAETKPTSDPTKSAASGASTSTDDEEWSAGTDFDKLDNEASKIFALWELAGSDVAAPVTDASPPAATAASVAPAAANGEAGADAESWSAGDPSLSTQPDPVPALALPAIPEAAPLAGNGSAAKEKAKRIPNQTLPAGSLALAAAGPVVADPVAPDPGAAAPTPAATDAVSAPAESAVLAAPAVVVAAATAPSDAKWTSAEAPVASAVPARSSSPAAPIDSIIIAPELRDSATAIDAKPLRISQAPDTVIDAKPLPKHEPVRARTVAANPEPVMGLPTRSNVPVLIALGAGLVVLLAVGGYYAFGRGDTTAAAPAPAIAATAPIAAPPVAPIAAPPNPNAVLGNAVPANAVPGNAAANAVPGNAAANAVPGNAAPSTPGGVPAAVPAAAAVAPPPVVEAPPAPATRLLRVRVEPAGASVTLDGQPISVPYELALPEGSDHVVVASLDGYGTETERVSLRRDATVSMRLDRIRERSSSSGGSRIGSRIRRGGSSGGSASGGSASGGSASGGSGSTSSGSGTFVTESPY